MIAIRCDEAAAAMGGRLTVGERLGADARLPAVSTDTRTLQAGQLFFALIGEHFDGHDFLAAAVERGAAAAVVSDPDAVSGLSAAGLCVIEVPETTGALQLLAHTLRQRWGGSLAAITGSMGKTTAKAFTATLLRQRYNVLESAGNLNNQIGVPLSLLRLESDHEVAVLELGMNQAGEILRLARVAAPDTGLLTNVAPVHLEFFEDGIAGIAAAKGELLGPLSGGTLVFNRDDEWVRRLARGFEGTTIPFGFEPGCRVRIVEFSVRGPNAMEATLAIDDDEIAATVPFAGRPFLYNLAAAVGVAVAHGLSRSEIETGIARLEPLPGRGRLRRIGTVSVWDDSYNANPRAIEALLGTVGQLPDRPRTLIVLGAMLELGAESEKLHRQVGATAAGLDPALLVSVGEGAEGFGRGASEAGLAQDRIQHCPTAEQAGRLIRETVLAGDLVVVKGSRGVRTEAVIQALEGAS